MAPRRPGFCPSTGWRTGGLTFYARYHSDKWGDFQTFWRFVVEDGKISKLDVGATNY